MLKSDRKMGDLDGKLLERQISVAEKDCDNLNLLVIKAKCKNKNQRLLKRFMFALKPNLRKQTLNALMMKKQKLWISDLNSEDLEGSFFLLRIIIILYSNIL